MDQSKLQTLNNVRAKLKADIRAKEQCPSCSLASIESQKKDLANIEDILKMLREKVGDA